MMETTSFPAIPNQNDTGTDWAYAMRRDMQRKPRNAEILIRMVLSAFREIIPGLYLGPYAAAMKSRLASLQQSRVTHIVCIRQEIEANFVRPNFPDHFKYLVLDIADSVTENIIRYFPKVKRFLEECFAIGGRALVHGNAGISRSAALVIAYVMEKHGLTYKDGLRYVQQRRFCINPNDGFAQQLMEYEPIYRARLTLQNGQSSQEKGIYKRKFCDDEGEGIDSIGCS
ncbi:Serine/threonine/tyrosine-interacting protein A [Lamellibrachia satsuma]|nr:Serine/threonine/tyrosine-interacting protein A [Lamellibrachia satsuma]